MSPLKLTSAITILANAIASNLSEGEITFLSSVLVQLGDTLATIDVLQSAIKGS